MGTYVPLRPLRAKEGVRGNHRFPRLLVRVRVAPCPLGVGVIALDAPLLTHRQRDRVRIFAPAPIFARLVFAAPFSNLASRSRLRRRRRLRQCLDTTGARGSSSRYFRACRACSHCHRRRHFVVCIVGGRGTAFWIDVRKSISIFLCQGRLSPLACTVSADIAQFLTSPSRGQDRLTVLRGELGAV